MVVYVLCEFSAEVRDAFARRGHDAWSCDLVPSEKGGKHFQMDCHSLDFTGVDLVIAHPPCTYLSISGAAYWRDRQVEQLRAIAFVQWIASLPVPRIAIENPIGKLSTAWQKPTQIIHPYWFGHNDSKKTCLWLFNLPVLVPTVVLPKPEPRGYCVRKSGDRAGRRYNYYYHQGKSSRERSRTFRGIAEAMAEQWSV